jgi:hypothetical protein
MNLSDRVRPNTEAAPWVVKEIKILENSYYKQQEELDATMMAFHILKKENTRLREALVLIANDDCPESCKILDKQCDPCIARAALENK